MAIVDGKIRCSKCREFKVLELFPTGVVRSGSGACKACSYEYSDAWRRKNKERVLARKRELYHKDAAASAAKAKEYRDKRRSTYSAKQKEWYDAQSSEKKKGYGLKKYGITLEQYQQMLEAQGGGCAICGAETNKNGKSLFVDHCHDTGAVRGILCYKCNTGLGSFKDNATLLARAVSYLTRSA